MSKLKRKDAPYVVVLSGGWIVFSYTGPHTPEGLGPWEKLPAWAIGTDGRRRWWDHTTRKWVDVLSESEWEELDV
jgi:hypothetical protein